MQIDWIAFGYGFIGFLLGTFSCVLVGIFWSLHREAQKEKIYNRRYQEQKAQEMWQQYLKALGGAHEGQRQ